MSPSFKEWMEDPRSQVLMRIRDRLDTRLRDAEARSAALQDRLNASRNAVAQLYQRLEERDASTAAAHASWAKERGEWGRQLQAARNHVSRVRAACDELEPADSGPSYDLI